MAPGVQLACVFDSHVQAVVRSAFELVADDARDAYAKQLQLWRGVERSYGFGPRFEVIGKVLTGLEGLGAVAAGERGDAGDSDGGDSGFGSGEGSGDGDGDGDEEKMRALQCDALVARLVTAGALPRDMHVDNGHAIA